MATGFQFDRSQIIASDALHDFSCAPCSDDGKNTEAIFECTDCQIFYCNHCVTGHNKFTKNHNVVDKSSKLFGQGQRQSRSFSSSELPTDVCEDHHGEVIKMFCGKHDLVCCTVCIAVNHRSCEGVEFIPHIARGYFKKQDQDKIQTSLEKVKNDLQTLKSKTQNELKELNKQRSDILDDIQDFKKRIIKRVEELEEKSVNEIQNKHKELVDDINASCITIDKKLKDVESQLDKLKCSKSVNEAQTFVDIKHGEKMISYGNDSVNMITARGIATIAFEVNKAIENYVHVTQSLGKLTVKTPTAATEVEVEYSYEAEQSDELTLKVGDIIKNVTICEGGWWEGELDGKRGTFPDNFVKIINAEDKNGREGKRQVCPGCNEKETWQTKYLSDGPPVLRKKKTSLIEKAIVVFSYEAEHEDELTLKVGDIVYILDKKLEDAGWCKGELNGKIGVFPENFVKIS